MSTFKESKILSTDTKLEKVMLFLVHMCSVYIYIYIYIYV